MGGNIPWAGILDCLNERWCEPSHLLTLVYGRSVNSSLLKLLLLWLPTVMDHIMSHCQPKQSQLSQVSLWFGIYYSNRTATKTINMHLCNCCILKGILRICIWILWLLNTQIMYCTTTVRRKSCYLLLAPYPVHQPDYCRRNVTGTRQAMPSSAR